MPNLAVLDEIEKGELIIAIDDARDAADRLAVFTAYGWESGEIGVFTDARTEALANLAANATPLIANPAHRYPAIEKGDRFNLCEAPFGPFRQIEPVPFFNRDAGEAQEQPEPGTPGPVTYDAATQTLSVAVMPDHSTTLHAYRQPLGGAPELAGSSPTTTVSVVQFGPLTPGVTYEFWLVGHTQSAGEGPQSNHVTHEVPVGP